MATNTRYTRKTAQPAAQAQPLAEKVLQQLAELAAELVQPRNVTRIIRRRIATQTQPLAELKWSRQPFAEEHLVRVIPATVVTTGIADCVDRAQPKKGNWVTAPVELLQHPVTGLVELLQHHVVPEVRPTRHG